ncbi:MAG: lysylphosphatidylglycerol synthase domain-containing protein [Phycisphaerae bacterium]
MNRQLLLRLAKYLALAAVLLLVGRALAGQFQAVDWSQVRLRPGFVAGAVLCSVAVFVSQMLALRFLLKGFVKTLPLRQMMSAAWVPLLGKYVPGKVAAIGSMVYLLKRQGVTGPVAFAMALMLDGLAVVTGLLAASPLLLVEAFEQRVPGGRLLALAVLLAGVVTIWPSNYARLIDFVLRRLKRDPLPRRPAIRDYLAPASCAVAQWLFYGTALWFMTNALTPVPASAWLVCVPVAALAMTVGYLALFAPGGIGVRDGIYLVGLTPLVGANAAVVVVAMRVMSILVEVTLSGVGLALLRRRAEGGTETPETA